MKQLCPICQTRPLCGRKTAVTCGSFLCKNKRREQTNDAYRAAMQGKSFIVVDRAQRPLTPIRSSQPISYAQRMRERIF